MAKSVLDIIINAKNNASGELKTVSTDVEGLSKYAGAAAAGVTAMGVAFAAVKAGQFAFDLAEAAEEGQFLKSAFDDLANGIDQSSSDMMDSMKQASQGMVSDVELVRSANRAMILGVADDADEMTALLEVATKRGRAMGLSTEQAFNDIVTGIGRMSPMILDNLGIVFDSEQVFEEYAQTLGLTADQLDDTQKKQALLNATIASTESMAMPDVSEFEILSTEIANTKQLLGEMFAPVVIAAAQDFTRIISELSGEIGFITSAVEHAIEVNSRYGIGFEGVRNAYTDTSKATRDLENDLDSARQKVIDIDSEMNSIGGAARIDELADDMKVANAEVRMLEGELKRLAEAENLVAQVALNDHLRSAAIGMGNMDEAARAAGDGLQELAADADTADSSVSRLLGTLSGYSSKFSIVDQARSQAVSNTRNEITELFMAGEISAQEAARAIDQSAAAISDWGIETDGTAESIELARLGIIAFGEVTSKPYEDLNEARIEAEKLDTAVGGVESSFSKIGGQASSFLGGIFGGTTAGIDADDLLPPEDAIDENARRLADIAINGFKDQDWLGEFAEEVPDLYATLLDSADPQAAAARMLDDFQDGIDNFELIDFDAAEARFERLMVGQANISQLAGNFADKIGDAIQERLDKLSIPGIPVAGGTTGGVGEAAAATGVTP